MIQQDKRDGIICTEIVGHAADELDVQIAADGRVWVNYHGQCLLRIGRGTHTITVGHMRSDDDAKGDEGSHS